MTVTKSIECPSASDDHSIVRSLSTNGSEYIVNSETIEVGMIVACYLSEYEDEEPQIGKVVALEKDSDNAIIEWMTGTYSEPWVVYKYRTGGSYSTWRETVPITLTLFPITLTASDRITSTLKSHLQSAYKEKREAS